MQGRPEARLVTPEIHGPYEEDGWIRGAIEQQRRDMFLPEPSKLRERCVVAMSALESHQQVAQLRAGRDERKVGRRPLLCWIKASVERSI
jgi:hypothetical protein